MASQLRRSLLWMFATVFAISVPAEAATVWGIYSAGDSVSPHFSRAPTVLFSHDTVSATTTQYGNISSDNGTTDLERNFDALAVNSAGDLWVFEVFASGTGGRFAVIDNSTIGGPSGVTANNAGPGPPFNLLSAYFSGASFDLQDQLWALDVTNNRIAQIDQTTGFVLSPATTFDITGTTATSVSDIAFDNAGNLYMIGENDNLYSVVLNTGTGNAEATLVNDINSDTQSTGLIGLTFVAGSNTQAYGLDSFAGDDDFGTIDLTGGSPLPFNVVDVVNTIAGRGDLASQLEISTVPEPTTVTICVALLGLAAGRRRRLARR